MYILQKLKERVSETPDKIILEREVKVSYAEFDCQTDALAKKIIGFGCPANSVIAVQCKDSLRFAFYFYGVLKASCRCAVINSTFSAETVCATLRQNNIKYYAGDLEEIGGISVLNFEACGYDEGVRLQAAEQEFPLICFTSGTTGNPKPIDINILYSENFISFLGRLGKEYDVNSFIFVSANSFITGINNLLWAVSYGVRTVFLENEAQNKNVFKILDTVKAHSIEGIMCPTAIIKLISGNTGIINRLPHSLKFAFFGGESITFSKEAICALKERDITFVNCYGMTEVCGATSHVIDWSAIESNVPVPAGKPVPNIEIKLRPLDDGSSDGRGLVSIRLNKNNRVLTEWHESQDCAVFDGETLIVLGRNDDCCKVRGYFVNLFGVETVISQISYVNDVVVAVLPDNRQVYHICVAIAMGEPLERLKNDLEKLLPEYMQPTRYMIVDSIPYNNSFKKNRSKIKEWFRGKV